MGLLAYLAVGVFPYLPSGLVVPGPWLYILWAVWLARACPGLANIPNATGDGAALRTGGGGVLVPLRDRRGTTAGLDGLGRSTFPLVDRPRNDFGLGASGNNLSGRA